MTRSIDLSGAEWIVSFLERADPVLIGAAKHAGGRWHAGDRHWRIPPSDAAAAVLAELAATHDFQIVGGVLATVTRPLAELSAATDADLSPWLPSDPEIRAIIDRLKPHQRAGVAYALTARRALVADDMGLGKTPTALAALTLGRTWPAVVAVPRKLVTNWCIEARRWTPAATTIAAVVADSTPYDEVAALRGRDVVVQAGSPQLGADLYVVPYSILAATAAALSRLEPAALVLDESQKVKTSTRTWQCRSCGAPIVDARCTGEPSHHATGSTRVLGYATHVVRAAKALSGAVHPDGLILALSGTPNKNRPSDLIAQLDIIGQLDQFGGRDGFIHRFAAGVDPDHRGRRRRSPNLIELHARLTSSCMVRRRTRDILPDIGIDRRPLVVDLPADGAALYRQARADVARYLADRAREIAEVEGLDPATEAFRARIRAEAAMHLVRRGVLLRVAAEAKVPIAVEWILDFLAQTDRKLVVFAHHRSVTKRLVADLGCDRIDGQTGDPTPIVDRFQQDPDRRVLVVGIMAGGVGLTLTAAADMLFVEQAWTPADLDQCEGRCFGRVNDAHSATATYLLAAGTEDEKVWTLIQQKRSEFHAVADGETPSRSSASIVGDLAAALVADLVPDASAGRQ